jgi:CheY-like chemotaxis protein
MGGKIEVESSGVQGQGALFTFTVRVGLPLEFTPETPPVFEGLATLAVLIVDNHRTTREVLAEMLEGVVAHITTVATGEQALAALANAPADVLVIESLLPDMDGITLLKQIQGDRALQPPPPGQTGCGLRVIMLYDTIQNIDRMGDKDLGVVARLLKPLSREALLHALQLSISPPKPVSAPVELLSKNATKLPSKIRLLLAEDDQINQTLALALLEDQGYQVTAVSNGQQALAAMNDGFDLVLMDVQMPEMNGLEATRRFRAQEAGSGHHLPIIAMTAHALPQDRLLCLEAGMDDYVAKPIHPETLYAMLARYRRV